MNTERPWARHYHETWQERAGDDRLPYWLRVTALAYGSHLDNGHARFKRGEIGIVLGKVDTETGELTPYPNVRHAIRTAVEYGWLEPESFWGCLVVPAHAIKKGEHGRKPACPIHAKRHREGKETPAERANPARSGHSVTALRPLNRRSVTASGGRTGQSVTASERKPFSSFLNRPEGSEQPQDDRSA